jgi:aminoglycoside phosphotransferase (APT) family kinase protein
MLTVDSVTQFLLDRGLLDRSSIIDGTLAIQSVARRNRNIKVDGPRGIGYLIKQPDESAEHGHDTLRVAAEFHRLCQEEPDLAEVARIVPRMLFDDPEHAVSVFELIPEALSLWPRSEAEDGLALVARAARPLGEALGTLHRVFSRADWADDPRLAWLPRSTPWVLSIHKPGLDVLADLSAANQQMLRVLQAPGGPGERLDRLRSSWRSENLIHGDIRFDNVVVSEPEGDQQLAPIGLWIADWETARFGDPAWDLAGALQDFLVLWVFSMPLSEDMPAGEIIANARIPLEDLRRSIRALWSGYRRQAGMAPAAADQFLLRAVAFSAARLIQTASELSHQADQLAGRAVILLQLSANLLTEPELGQLQLYGIPLCGPVL